MTDEAQLLRNDERHRYELWVGQERVGTLKIRDEPQAIVLVETVVRPEFEGHGYGSRLVATALSDARQAGRKVRIECSFARSYVDRHPQEQDLLLEQG